MNYIQNSLKIVKLTFKFHYVLKEKEIHLYINF